MAARRQGLAWQQRRLAESSDNASKSTNLLRFCSKQFLS